MRMWRVMAFATGILLAGCAAAPAERSAQREVFETRPICTTDKQCEAMWAAARDFVSARCGMKIQHYSADYIETYNSPSDSGNIACRVTKTPERAGGYSIHILAGCGFFLYCSGSPARLMLEFNQHVSAAGAGWE